jgi:hypothetical protein
VKRSWRAAGPVLLVLALAVTGCDAPDSPTAGGSTATSARPAPSPSPSPSVPPPVVKPKVSKDTLNYFYKIALGAEYGDKVNVVIKWAQPVVTIKVDGSVSGSSRKCLNRVISDFNALTETTDLRITGNPGADIKFHFAPVSRFKKLEPEYVPGNDGFFYVTWRGDHTISSSTVLIRTTGISSSIRCHLIREELTQTMGLMSDSTEHTDSVFYGRYTPAPTKYSALDKRLIKLLYGGAVKPGDGKKEVARAVVVTG